MLMLTSHVPNDEALRYAVRTNSYTGVLGNAELSRNALEIQTKDQRELDSERAH